MILHYVSSLLENKNYAIPKLDICIDNDISISVLQWQVSGNLNWNGKNNLSANSKEHSDKARAFLELSKKEKASIVLTPEYSFPYEIVNEIFKSKQYWPDAGKLWALCLEGISQVQFNSLCNKIKTSKRLKLINDNFKNNLIERDYVNCLMYLFRLSNDVLAVLFQLKIEAATDRLNRFESAYMTLGNDVFLFDLGCGKEKANMFFSLICADFLNLNYEKILNNDYRNSKMLIFHPQLNPKPSHESFIHMKKRLFEFSDRFKLISLNWAKNSSVIYNGKKILEIESSQSFFYKKSNTKDVNIKLVYLNHEQGIYYGKNNYMDIWYSNETEHCLKFFIAKSTLESKSSAAISHDEPTNITNYGFMGNFWEPIKRCFIDMSWIDSTQIAPCMKCQSNYPNLNCQAKFIDQFLGSILGDFEYNELMWDNENSGFLRTSLSSKEVYISKKVEKKKYIIQNVMKCVSEGILPDEFKHLKNNFSWTFNKNFNLSAVQKKPNAINEALVVFSETNREYDAKKIIDNIKNIMGSDIVRKIILYYPAYNGYKIYPVTNEYINNPNFTISDFDNILTQ